MGNQPCKDTQQMANMLGTDIRNDKGQDFENILKSQNVALLNDTSCCISLWKLIVICSSEYDLVQMENICRCITSYHKMLGNINEYKKYCFFDPQYSHIKFTSNDKIQFIHSQSVRAGNFLYAYNLKNEIVSGKCNFNDPIFAEHENQIIINHNHNNIGPIILAQQIREFVFKKFKLDIKVIDLLIHTLQFICTYKETEKDYYFKSEKDYFDSNYDPDYDLNYVSHTDMYKISKLIQEKNLDVLETMLATYNGYIYEIHEIDEPIKTIWHMLVIATLTYTMDEITRLTKLLTIYCSHLNINKCASTTKSITMIYKQNDQNILVFNKIDYVTATGTYYDRELQMLKPCTYEREMINSNDRIGYYHIELDQLRPVTIAFHIKKSAPYWKGKSETIGYVIQHVISNLIILNQNLKTLII